MVRPAAFSSGFAGVLYIRKVCWFILLSRGLHPKTYRGRVSGPAGTQPARGILELLKKNPGSMYSTIGSGTASQATPQGRRHKRAEVGIELAIKRLPARRHDN
jgi:hypothetical protein